MKPKHKRSSVDDINNKRAREFLRRNELDGRKFGKVIGKKKLINPELDVASFCCPYCGTNLRINLIRLRQALYECRKCAKIFIKDNAVDEFDYDGLY